MREVIIGLQLAALIPILVVLFYKPALNQFFKLLLASILLSLVSDSIGTFCSFYFRNNLFVLCIYPILNAILITTMWQKVPFYDNASKRFVRNLGYLLTSIMIFELAFKSFTESALYIIGGISILLVLIFALHFYRQKILLSTYTPLLKDPYFITASGYILFSLSTIIILVAQIFYIGDEFLFYTWTMRQIFYLIYNIIIAYAFFVLYKTQTLK
ncbi:MAG: hypothetical protein AAGA77_01940 [Bacteroidota bacterium]